jgi:hypothetical protein
MSGLTLTTAVPGLFVPKTRHLGGCTKKLLAQSPESSIRANRDTEIAVVSTTMGMGVERDMRIRATLVWDAAW